MMLLIAFSIVNLVGLVLAHLNTWRPITFKRLDPCQVYYCTLVANVLVGVAAFRHVRHTGRPLTPMDLIEIQRAVFRSDEYWEAVRLEYQMNWASFLLHEALLWLFLS